MMDNTELLSLLKYWASKAGPDTLPWFFGCEYECQLCVKSKPFYTPDALKRHIYKFHIDPWNYLLAIGMIESRAAYFNCKICDDKTVKQNFHDIKRHLYDKHNGMSMKKYTNVYHFGHHDNESDSFKEEDTKFSAEGAENLEGGVLPRIKEEENHIRNLEMESVYIKTEASYEEYENMEPQVMMGQEMITAERIRLKKKKIPKPPNIPIASKIKNFPCSQCDKKFVSDFRRKRHEKLHLGLKPYKCEQCGRGFTDERSRDLHIRNLHMGLKPYNCDECGKCFSYPNSLRIHKLVHAQEQNFVCDLCGKTFISGTYLKRHRMIHGTEKALKCDICGKGFSNESGYYKHKRMHKNGPMSYKCEHCGKAFNDSGNFYRHRKSHLKQQQMQP